MEPEAYDETSVKNNIRINTTPYLAHYFYALNDQLPVNELFSHFSEKLPLVKCHDQLFISNSKIALSKPFSSIEENRTINFYLGTLGELTIFAIIWNSDDFNEQILDDEIIELENIRKSTKALVGNILGESTVYSGTKPFNAENYLDNLSENKKRHISIDLDTGLLLKQITSINDWRHFYGLEIVDKDLANIFLLNNLPHIDLLLHKLKKEVLLFEEQRRVFEQQKIEVDKEINKSLHNKTTLDQKSENYRNRLENEINKLAGFYGKLSNALYVTSSSIATLERDLRKIKNLDVKLSPNSEQSELSRYYEKLFEEQLELLEGEQESLRLSQENASAAISIVQTKVELFRGNEEMALQTQTKELLDQNVHVQNELLALQLATGVIEFVLVFYYTLKSWEGLLPEKLTYIIHPLIKLGTVSAFALSLVMFTHFVANKIKKKPAGKGMLISGVSLLLSFGAMFVISYLIMGLKK